MQRIMLISSFVNESGIHFISIKKDIFKGQAIKSFSLKYETSEVTTYL